MATFQQSTGFQFTKAETTSASRLSVPVSHAVEATGKRWCSCFTDRVSGIVQDLHLSLCYSLLE